MKFLIVVSGPFETWLPLASVLSQTDPSRPKYSMYLSSRTTPIRRAYRPALSYLNCTTQGATHAHVYSPATNTVDYSSRVAHALKIGGFEGHFVTCSFDNEPLSTSVNGWLPPPRPQESIVPWPEHPISKYNGFVYPPRLEITSPTAFSLTLPCPTIIPFYQFLQDCTASQNELKRYLVSVLYIWTRSLHLVEFTPECLALMVVHFMQVRQDTQT